MVGAFPWSMKSGRRRNGQGLAIRTGNRPGCPGRRRASPAPDGPDPSPVLRGPPPGPRNQSTDRPTTRERSPRCPLLMAMHRGSCPTVMDAFNHADLARCPSRFPWDIASRRHRRPIRLAWRSSFRIGSGRRWLDAEYAEMDHLVAVKSALRRTFETSRAVRIPGRELRLRDAGIASPMAHGAGPADEVQPLHRPNQFSRASVSHAAGTSATQPELRMPASWHSVAVLVTDRRQGEDPHEPHGDPCHARLRSSLAAVRSMIPPSYGNSRNSRAKPAFELRGPVVCGVASTSGMKPVPSDTPPRSL